MMYCLYAYAFFFGGLFKYEGVKNGDEEWTGGAILSVMCLVIFGAFYLLGAAPHFKAVVEGRIAGKLAYEVIDHVPKVVSGRRPCTRDQLTGSIEFRDVQFKYPSRADLTVLKSLTCSFAAGKTTALVGPSGSGKSTVI